jgi:RNA polymerase sigma-32 factor
MAKKVVKKTIVKKISERKKSHKKVSAEIVENDSEANNPIANDIEDPIDLLELKELDNDIAMDSGLNDKDIIPLLSSEKSENKRLPAAADPVATYISEIKKYPLMTREQEQEVSQKYYETKDPKYAQMLVTSNLRFVVKVAAEYSKFGARMIDLIQEGNMGLMHAVKDFNPYKGVKLITYAVWWIRGYIQDYLMKQYSLVKIGTTQSQKKLFYQLQKQKEALDELSNPEKLKLASERLGIPEDEIIEMAKRLSGRDLSLSAPIGDEDRRSMLDLQKDDHASPDELLEKNEDIHLLHVAVDKIRSTLTEKEKIVLEERLLSDEPLTLQEIGDKYGITREAVRQTESRLLKKIKEAMIS